MIKIHKVEYEPKDMPAGYQPGVDEVTCYECHPDFSDKAMHFRGYIIAEYKEWMAARPDIYIPAGEGKVKLREVFVDAWDWARLKNQAWRDHFGRGRRW